MTIQEQAALASQAINGNHTAANRLYATIERYLLKVMGHTQASDLRSEAFIAYRECLHRWDPLKGPLARFVAFQLRCHLKEVRRTTALVVVPRAAYRKGDRASAILWEEDTGDDASLCQQQ